MSNPADTKKGAVPLDAGVRAAQDTPPAEASQAAERSAEPPAEDGIAQMCTMLKFLYDQVRGGHVRALSCTFVDDSGVPQTGFWVGPNMAVPMLAGVVVAQDDLKAGASKTIVEYREFLRQKAMHEAQQQAEAAPPEGQKPTVN